MKLVMAPAPAQELDRIALAMIGLEVDYGFATRLSIHSRYEDQ